MSQKKNRQMKIWGNKKSFWEIKKSKTDIIFYYTTTTTITTTATTTSTTTSTTTK